MYTHMHAGTCEGQKRALDSLGLKLQAVVSRPMWVLRTELRSSPRAEVLSKAQPSCQPLKAIF